nr:hypothetical protein [Tanacetum cinerariifolium]
LHNSLLDVGYGKAKICVMPMCHRRCRHYHTGIHRVATPLRPAWYEVDIGFDEGRDKPLHPTDMFLYSWDGGLNVCLDLTGSSPLTQSGTIDFVSGRAAIEVAQQDAAAADLAAAGAALKIESKRR